MDKKIGLHLYINISNFDDILEQEETSTGKPLHSMHALDTYFSSIESFCKKNYKNCTIEKITGSRLHLYIEENISNAFMKACDISCYSYKLSKFITTEIGKYKSLRDFKIQVGACYGKFYLFEFQKDNYSELTSIGYAANYAAKLQNLCKLDSLSISEDVYESLPSSTKILFSKFFDNSIKKYEQSCYYGCELSSLTKNSQSFIDDLYESKDRANSINLGEINFRNAEKALNLDTLSKTESKRLYGIPFFADVRGFTQKFNEDDSNLEDMSELTKNILTSMFETVTKGNGIHIQFQGDREFALFHNYKEYNCYKDAIITGLRLIDCLKQYDINIGIGQSLGNMFASKIGARDEKDYILLGRAVLDADYCEDKKAKENQIVITAELYNHILLTDKILAEQFHSIENNKYYYTTKGYDYYNNKVRSSYLLNSTNQKAYNGAWKK